MNEEEYDKKVINAFKELEIPLSVTDVTRIASMSFRKAKQVIKRLEKKGTLIRAKGRGTWWKLKK